MIDRTDLRAKCMQQVTTMPKDKAQARINSRSRARSLLALVYMTKHTFEDKHYPCHNGIFGHRLQSKQDFGKPIWQ